MSLRMKGAALAMALTAVLGVAVTGSATAAKKKKLTTVTVAFTPTTDGMALPIGIQQGFFTQHGIKIVYGTAAPTGAEQVAQILNGQVTLGQGAFTSTINAVAHGLPVVVTNAQDQDFATKGQNAFGVMVSKSSGITSFKDLDGKTIAVNSLAGNWQVSLEAAVQAAGGDPTSIKLVAIPFAGQVAALESGKVDAISSLQPFVSQLLAAGYTDLGDPQAIGFNGQKNSVVNVTFMSLAYTKAHPTVVKNFVAAMQESDNWANKHPAATRKVIEQVTKTPAKIVNATPLPTYTTHIGATQTQAWENLELKYNILTSAPPVNQVLWSGAPR